MYKNNNSMKNNKKKNMIIKPLPEDFFNDCWVYFMRCNNWDDWISTKLVA